MKKLMNLIIIVVILVLVFPLKIVNANEEIHERSLTNDVKNRRESIINENILKEGKSSLIPEVTEEDAFTIINNKNGTKTLISPLGSSDRIAKDAIDNEFKYSNKKNSLNFKFGESSTDPILLEAGKYSLKYNIINGNTVTAEVYENKIQFREVWGNTKLVYFVHGNQLKMYIQLASADAPTQFKFQLETNNLSYNLLDDQTIQFFDPETKETVFSIPPMWILGAGETQKKQSSKDDYR